MNWLLFSMTLKSSSSLLIGKLRIMHGDTSIASYTATSGLAGYQEKKHQSWRGVGAMPECKKVGISSYSVLTESCSRRSRSENIELFFHVNKPFRILVDGIWRAGFGIHFDAQNPGSGGCVALRDKAEWNEFIVFMSNYSDKGYSSIPLIVEYDALPSASATAGNCVAV